MRYRFKRSSRFNGSRNWQHNPRRMRVADVFRKKANLSNKRCKICGDLTQEGKLYCTDHVEHHPYIQSLLNKIEEKHYEEFEVSRLGEEGIDPDDIDYEGTDLEKIFTNAGYTIEDGILDASDFGVPQRRKRYFMVGVKNPVKDIPLLPIPNGDKAPTARDILLSFPPHGEPGNDRITNAKINFATNPVMRKSPYSGMLFNGLGRPVDLNRPVQTLAASFGGNKTPIIDERELRDGKTSWIENYHSKLIGGHTPDVGRAPDFLRRMTIDECIVFQDFPRKYDLIGPKTSIFRQIGNAVPPGLAKAVALQLLKHL